MLDTFSKTAIKKTNVMKKLNLDAFKAMAENVQTEEVMEQIEGGSWSDCHGFWGQLRKALIASDLSN